MATVKGGAKSRAKSKAKSKASDPKAWLDKLDGWLAKHGVARRVVYSKPVLKSVVDKAQKSLGVVFPPSYVAFVTRHGTFTISGELTGRGSGNDTKLFDPSEAVKATLRYRKELAKSKDEESKEILNDALLFCADPIGEVFLLFVLSSARSDGEMKTRFYDYQDPANNDPHFDGDGTFASVLREIVALVQKEALARDE